MINDKPIEDMSDEEFDAWLEEAYQADLAAQQAMNNMIHTLLFPRGGSND